MFFTFILSTYFILSFAYLTLFVLDSLIIWPTKNTYYKTNFKKQTNSLCFSDLYISIIV